MKVAEELRYLILAIQREETGCWRRSSDRWA